MKYEELIEKFISQWSEIIPQPLLEEIIQKLLNQIESKENINSKNRQDERFPVTIRACKWPICFLNSH